MTEQSACNITWRPLELADIPQISEWFWNADDVALFDRALPVPVGIDILRENWRKSLEQTTPPSAYWFVAEDKDRSPVGIAALESVNYIQGDAVLPFFVAERFRKNGLATAMTVSMLDLAFRKLRLHRVTTFYRSDNDATRRALDKVGFSTEGCFREGWFTDGVRKDIVIAGILGSEWLGNRERVIREVARTCNLSFTPTCWKVVRET